jgi:hypothetical protein
MARKNKEQYNEYMRGYLPSYRKQERELLQKAKEQFGWTTPKQKQRGLQL